MKRTEIIAFLCVVSFTLMDGCGNGGNGNGDQQDNPVPTLTSISPASKAAHMPSFTLTATGTNFILSSKIVFNGVEKQTTFASPTELTCQIDPDDIKENSILIQDRTDSNRVLDTTVSTLVRNPSPGGGDSNSIDFAILSNHTFSEPTIISDTSGISFDPSIVLSSDGDINVGWVQDISGNWDIYFSRSADNGVSWTQPMNISNNTGNSFRPVVVIDSADNLNVAWEDNTLGQEDVYFIRSIDSGASWTQPVTLSNDPETSRSIDIAVDSSGNIYVVWHDRPSGNGNIYYSRSEH